MDEKHFENLCPSVGNEPADVAAATADSCAFDTMVGGHPEISSDQSASPAANADVAGEASAPAALSGVYRVPEGYRIEGGNLEFGNTSRNGSTQWFPICHQISVLAQTCDQSNLNWGRLVSFRDPNGIEHQVNLAMKDCLGKTDSWISTLLQNGLALLDRSPLALMKLTDYIADTGWPDTFTTHNAPGWISDRAFILGGKVIGEDGESHLPVEEAALPFSRKGTLGEWQRLISDFAPGNNRITFAVCLGFAPILLKLLNASSFGVHFFGASSSGKTTLAGLAASLFSDPAEFVSTWNATTAGLEALATSRNDGLIVLDEADPTKLTKNVESIYSLVNSRSKVRSSGSMVPRTPKTWRSVFLSTGEKPLYSTSEDRAGATVRMVDIPAEVGGPYGCFEDLKTADAPSKFAEQLARGSGEYYGTAAPEFIGRLLKEPRATGWAREDFDTIEQALSDPAHTPQDRRILRCFAVIGAAGLLACRLSVLPLTPSQIQESVRLVFAAAMSRRTPGETGEAAGNVAHVRNFLALHGSSRFENWMENNRIYPVRDRVGFRRDSPTDKRRFYILSEPFRTTICKGRDANAVARSLIDAGYLLPDKSGNPTRSEHVPGHGNMRVYVIHQSILKDGAPDFDSILSPSESAATGDDADEPTEDPHDRIDRLKRFARR